MTTTSLRAIFFDIDDTLFSTTVFAEKARRAGIRAMIDMGLRVDPDEAYRDLMEVIQEFSTNYGAHYDKFLSRQTPHALAGANPTLLAATAVVAYHETKVRELSAYEDVLQVLRLLSERDLILGIISSGLRIKQAEKIIRLGIARYIDPRAVFITDEVGIGKPNPKLYLRACESLGLPPAACMHVGDHPRNDIDPAKQVGMITVLNRRERRHSADEGTTEPDHVIDNFLDLIDVLQRHYALDFGLEV